MLSRMSNTTFVGLMIGIVVGLIGIGYVVGLVNKSRRDSQQASSESSNENNDRLTGDKPPGPGYVKRGGVWRKETEVANRQTAQELPKTSGLGKRIGNSPRVDWDANPATRAVSKALEEDNDPSLVSSFIAPEPFDRESYEANPEEYLAIAPPGRIWQAADSGEGVTRIQKASTGYQSVVQGDTVTLKVNAEPGMPVTFYTPDLGEFPNRLKSITVAADEEGVAETQYTATTGTYGEVGILASSPVHSGQARFLVNVNLPSETVRIGD